MKQKGEKTPRKLNNSLLFSRSISLSLFLFLFLFLFNCREGGRETVEDRMGGCRLRRSNRQLYSLTV
jgi:hypothetical protein